MDASTIATIQENIAKVSESFAEARGERNQRRYLDRADFERLCQAGFFRCSIPEAEGGLWRDRQHSLRPLCEMLRTLARGDPSVALVAAMHPAVVLYWLSIEEAPEPFRADYRKQRALVLESIRSGAWWGTVTSEPGTGGDLLKTRAVAKPVGRNGQYLITGDKHFGSGAGITSYMVTTAMPEGEEIPELFYLDMRGIPWDGSKGVTLTAEWDGHGMSATQSHAFRFDNFPAFRFGWPGNVHRAAATVGPLGTCEFAAVTLGIVETAVEAARQKIEPRRNELRPYERVEWARAATDAWLIEQAYEGMLAAATSNRDPMTSVLCGKLAIGELAESVTTRLCKVLGGSAFSRSSPFGQWAQDVRALGFLRPPWALNVDQLYARLWAEQERPG